MGEKPACLSDVWVSGTVAVVDNLSQTCREEAFFGGVCFISMHISLFLNFILYLPLGNATSYIQ